MSPPPAMTKIEKLRSKARLYAFFFWLHTLFAVFQGASAYFTGSLAACIAMAVMLFGAVIMLAYYFHNLSRIEIEQLRLDLADTLTPTPDEKTGEVVQRGAIMRIGRIERGKLSPIVSGLAR